MRMLQLKVVLNITLRVDNVAFMEVTWRLGQVSKANRNKTVKIFRNPFEMLACAILSKPTMIRQSSPRTVKHVAENIQNNIPQILHQLYKVS